MSYALVSAAFDAAMALFNTLDGDLVYEGNVYLPIEGRGYFALRMAAYTRINLGNGADAVMSETGSYQISVYRPAAEGRGMAAMIADNLVATFPRGLSLALGNGRNVVVEYASAQPAMDSGAWMQVPVTVAWIA